MSPNLLLKLQLLSALRFLRHPNPPHFVVDAVASYLKDANGRDNAGDKVLQKPTTTAPTVFVGVPNDLLGKGADRPIANRLCRAFEASIFAWAIGGPLSDASRLGGGEKMSSTLLALRDIVWEQ